MRLNIEEIGGVRRVIRFPTKATNWKQIFSYQRNEGIGVAKAEKYQILDYVVSYLE